MTVSLRISAFAILAGASFAALAADVEQVKAPFVEKGDCWSYRAENMQYQGKPIRDYELCVTLVDTLRSRILAVATTKDDGREIDTIYSLEWAAHASISGVVSPQGVRYFKFPLSVGDTWSTEYEFHSPRINNSRGKGAYEMRVVGWEDVTVPAGTFRAIRIDGKGTGHSERKAADYAQTITLWYSPKVNRYVKLRFQAPEIMLSEELTGFRLNQ